MFQRITMKVTAWMNKFVWVAIFIGFYYYLICGGHENLPAVESWMNN